MRHFAGVMLMLTSKHHRKTSVEHGRTTCHRHKYQLPEQLFSAYLPFAAWMVSLRISSDALFAAMLVCAANSGVLVLV